MSDAQGMSARNIDARRELVVPFELRKDAPAGDGLTLSGYAAVFDTPTRIVDWEGEFDEQIAEGAFKRTINAHTPVMQFDHGHHPVLGSLPIASIRTLKEDRHGLYVEARVFDNWLTQPLRDAIAGEAVSGMSFRFSVVRDEWDYEAEPVPMRTLQEVRLYELGPVVFPAYAETSVALRSLARYVPEVASTLWTIDTGTSEAPAADSSTVEEPADANDPADVRPLVRSRSQRRASALLRLRGGVVHAQD